LAGSASAQQPPPDPAARPAAETEARSPWLLVPMFSSSRLGTALGGLGACVFDRKAECRSSARCKCTSTLTGLRRVCRTSSGADHHRIVVIAIFGLIKNDYDDYLGTGEPLKTDDDLKALAGRYLFRAKETGSSARRGAPPTTRCEGRPRKTIWCSRHSACVASSRRRWARC
jgi:hypothetical protein